MEGKQVMEENKFANTIIHKIFNRFDNSFDAIKTYGTDKNPLFEALEIGKILGIVKIRTTIECYDEDEVIRECPVLKSGKTYYVSMLTKSGIYRILYNSKSPMAKIFRKFIVEVLDQLQETGKAKLKTSLDEMENRNNEILKQLDQAQARIEKFEPVRRRVEILENTFKSEFSDLAGDITNRKLEVMQRYYCKPLEIYIVNSAALLKSKPKAKSRAPKKLATPFMTEEEVNPELDMLLKFIREEAEEAKKAEDDGEDGEDIPEIKKTRRRGPIDSDDDNDDGPTYPDEFDEIIPGEIDEDVDFILTLALPGKIKLSPSNCIFAKTIYIVNRIHHAYILNNLAEYAMKEGSKYFRCSINHIVDVSDTYILMELEKPAE